MDTMVSLLAVTLALAFWSPYSTEPVCPQGVQVDYFAPGTYGKDVWGYAPERATPDCHIELRRGIGKATVAFQCAMVAHEIGHRFLGLPHSSDPRNIMYEWVPIPRACYPRTRKAP